MIIKSPSRIHRHRKGYRHNPFVLRPHGDRRHHDHFMRIDACLSDVPLLRALRYRPGGSPPRAGTDPDLPGAWGALERSPLGSVIAPVNRQVILLGIFQKFHKIFMVFGAMGLVTLIGRTVYGIKKSIHAHTSLETGRCLLAAKPLHLYFILQIFRAHMYMCKPVDLPSGKRRRGRSSGSHTPASAPGHTSILTEFRDGRKIG